MPYNFKIEKDRQRKCENILDYLLVQLHHVINKVCLFEIHITYPMCTYNFIRLTGLLLT